MSSSERSTIISRSVLLYPYIRRACTASNTMRIAEAKHHLFSVLTSDEGIYIGIQALAATANDEKEKRVITRLKHMSYGSISKSKGLPYTRQIH